MLDFPRHLLCTCALALLTVSCAEQPNATTSYTALATIPGGGSVADTVAIHPIFHASTVLTQGDRVIFVDPYNGAARYTSYGAPDMVLITHTHPDHMDTATLAGLDLSAAILIAPQAVIDALTDNPFVATYALANGEEFSDDGVTVTAVAAYNPPPKENFHPRGKFNGYVLELDGKRYYFSGDTEGVDEMRALENIDVAFVCMNLPYTMDIEQAASAVADFAPRVVYPYHYRNQDETKSDVEAFRQLVQEANPDIEVRLENWYPAK
ncbi:MBL fold metallo-hydrolase [Neolewinella sp.]|uniref:MBL fold metallo-hydrolase n=1 Tax=Neolewinella sp. TaxID=2993543 RepID=UPI003B518B20